MMWSTKLSHFKGMSGEIGCLDTNTTGKTPFLKAPCVIWCRTTSCGIPRLMSRILRLQEKTISFRLNPSRRRCGPICRQSGGEAAWWSCSYEYCISPQDPPKIYIICVYIYSIYQNVSTCYFRLNLRWFKPQNRRLVDDFPFFILFSRSTCGSHRI